MGHSLRITDLESAQRPRERLSRLGPRALTDAELVAILLGSGSSGVNAIDLAHDVIAEGGGLNGLATVDVLGLLRVKGIGLAAATRVCATFEIARRTADTDSTPVRTSADIAAVVTPLLVDCAHERLIVVVLNRSLRLVDTVVLADGVSTHAAASIADILRAVLVRKGSAFALAHNHPGGSVKPSAADAKATGALRGAASAYGLRFLDHVVVAGAKWRSVTG